MSLDRKLGRVEQRLAKLGIRQEDVVERFVRSSSPGGQNTNKVSTCVYLKHIPTGIQVKCGVERTQGANRYLAKEILLRKVEEMLRRRTDLENKLKAKALRRQRKRSRRAKELILEHKLRRAQKKLLRRKICEVEL